MKEQGSRTGCSWAGSAMPSPSPGPICSSGACRRSCHLKHICLLLLPVLCSGVLEMEGTTPPSCDLIKAERAAQCREEAPTLTAGQKLLAGCLVPGTAACMGEGGSGLRSSHPGKKAYVSWEGPSR